MGKRRTSERDIDGLSRSFNTLTTSGDGHRIIIGVDYGTTYTGVSYIDTSKSTPALRDVQMIRTFPGPNGDTVWKAPSRIAYARHNKKKLDADKWGYEVASGLVSYSWTKLLLDRSARATRFDDPALKKMEGTGMLGLPSRKTARDVVSDYLKHVYDWTMEYLAKRMSQELLDVTPIECWFTVPAIWSESAKEATLSAAKAAGFGTRAGEKVSLISEPEAAGYATLRTFSDSSGAKGLRPGDGVIICDCGGGTVDIISYRIVKLSPKLQFEELVPGIGGKCGSTYIDRQFHEWMSAKFGAHFDNLPSEKIGPGSRFMRDFESQKRNFDSSRRWSEAYEVSGLVMHNLNSAKFEDIWDDEEQLVRISADDMRSFFDPVVVDVISLLDDQVTRATRAAADCNLKTVVLVGGFGDSNYLNSKVKEWCQNRSLRLVCPEDPQAAIARGAALRGLVDMQLLQRKSRRHYGLKTSLDFRQGTDPESLGWIDDWSGKKYCSTRIDWAVSKGASITEDTKILIPRNKAVPDPDCATGTIMLLSCSDDNVPDYSTDPTAEKIGELHYRLDGSYVSQSPNKIVKGRRLWDVHYGVEVALGQEKGTLTLRVVTSTGEECGKASIEYDAT